MEQTWDLGRALREFPHFFVLKKYRRGETIFQEGESPEAVYLLRSGLVKAVKYSPKGEPFTMEIIFPGQLFAMIAVMDRKPYPVSAVALKNSEIYWISSGSFHELLRKYSDFSKEVYSEIGNHMRHSQKMRSLFNEPMEKRIAYILGLLLDSLGDRLEFCREDIAEMVGCTPETAIRVLGGFRKKKIIRSGWKWLTIVNRDRLKKLSGQE